MVSPSNLLSLALLYICILFAVAWYVDRHSDHGVARRSPVWRGVIYALSLAVYCSSWTFYGAVGSAAESPWSHAPIYLGPIFLYLFAWPVIRRLLAVGARHRVTSIADYIGARYGKRQSLAVLVTLVAAAAVLPYIALQFKALTQAWSIVGGSVVEVEELGGDAALLTAIILAAFTILFGTRRLDSHERHQGIVTAIAVESLVKLLAFFAVAVLAIVYLVGLPDLDAFSTIPPASDSELLSMDFIARTLISALAILCLPRQFHVMVVEAQEETNTGISRWLFPAYLMLFMFLVLPISVAGGQVFSVSQGVNPDTYVQLLPIALDSKWIAVAAFIGGISAATGMVIVATLSLAIMVTNEVVTPLILRFNANSPEAVLKLGDSLRRVRQFTIAGIFLAAWLVTRQVMGIPWLAQIGFISFLAASQLAPALLAGLYWKRAHGLAVITGLLAGLALWFYCSVLPVILPVDNSLMLAGPLGVDWLRPMNLMGIAGEHRLAYATAWSLGVNVFLLIAMSLFLKPSLADRRQARVFIGELDTLEYARDQDYDLSLIRVSQLHALLPPFIERDELQQMWREFESDYQQRLLPGDRAPRFVVSRVESTLAQVIGATSAHKAMEQLESSQQLAYSDIAGMVSDVSKLNTFNRELLQTTVESLLQGVSVVDKDLNLVAWNSRYQELFDYPQRFLYVGCPIERVYRFNAERGIMGTREGSIDQDINRRLGWLREGSPYRLERILPNGTVIDIRGNPMPHGGFVTTYIDITDYRDIVTELEETKIELEARVASGSQTLSETNTKLRRENRLRAQVESKLRDAHLSKTRFMSATSHDLLQPINAARLFTAALKSRVDGVAGSNAAHIVDKIDLSLHRAEQLISELREMSRLDSGRQLPRPEHFYAGRLFESLFFEFQPSVQQKGLGFSLVSSELWLYSDYSLLYRIVQNLLSNAVKYTSKGKILLGLRRRTSGVEIQVWDTGPGIAEADQVRIFQEFERLQGEGTPSEEGLGLGLAIVQRYADLLDSRLQMYSIVGRGSMFSITVPYGEVGAANTAAESESIPRQNLEGLCVLCMDNDASITEGMEQLLLTMDARVFCVAGRDALLRRIEEGDRPDIILADYHLDGGDDGVSAVLQMRKQFDIDVPCIIISADDSDAVREKAKSSGFRFLPKPVQAAQLRALILALTSAS
ncbi:MAG: histidine kinase [Gammaproteobacteria bacterium]|nr:MAG: histidine kinase [Gammaproteobacteria bacterium]